MSKFPRGNAQLEEKLIAAVRKRRPLWDNTTPLHKSVKVLIHLWQQVAKELDMDEVVVKRKWKSLRDYFFRQVKDLDKSSVSSSGSDNVVVKYKYCLWPLYDKLKFLQYDDSNKRRYKVKLSPEDYKILDEMNGTDNNSRAAPELETIIYHVPADDSSPPRDDDSDECEIVSVENVKNVRPYPAIPASSKTASLSHMAQYLPPLMKKIAPKPVPTLSNTNQNAKEPTHSNSTQQAKEPTFSNRAKHAKEPTLSNSTQHANEPTLSNSTQHAKEPIPSNSTQHAKEAVLSNSTQHTIEPTPSNSTQHAKEATLSNSAQHAKEPTLSNNTQHAKELTLGNNTQHTKEAILSNSTQHAIEPTPSNSTQYAKEPTQQQEVKPILELIEPEPFIICKKQSTNNMQAGVILKRLLNSTTPPPLCKITPRKRIKLTPDATENLSQRPETNEKDDSDYQFFKSLVPFMKELPLKHRLRVRNSIQVLILKELESVDRDAKNVEVSSTEESTRTGDATSIIDFDASSAEDTSQNTTSAIVKEEVSETVGSTDNPRENSLLIPVRSFAIEMHDNSVGDFSRIDHK